jgi:hypothetical protein
MGARCPAMLVVLPLIAGCQTHLNLRNNSVKTTGTIADLKTYKSDGTLDSTQVTTTEVDEEARAKLKRDGGRPHQYVNPPAVNPRYFFVPR